MTQPMRVGRREADVTDVEALARAFADADAVVHLAAESNVRAAWRWEPQDGLR
jgi:nucleoside-diphosphate-sugar epimerase